MKYKAACTVVRKTVRKTERKAVLDKVGVLVLAFLPLVELL
ncbi:MAG: hypothetical protein ACRC24_07050 [Vibrionaceae bacterium]